MILVTGGAGFIGSNIVAELTADARSEVAVCDRLGVDESGKWRNLAKHAITDFIGPGELWSWLEAHAGDLDCVIHMGAISSTTESDVDRIISNNFGFSRDLFAWCAMKGVRLIWASSGATYGDGSAGFDDDDSPAALAALRPLNAYGWSKALFDLHAARAAARPPQWAGLKFFNVYGPNEGHKGAMRSVVAKLWDDIAAGRPARLFRSYSADRPDGGQQRDFVYVRDAARALAWLVRHPAVNGVFNLGTGAARSFRDLAEATFKAAGKEARIEFIDMPEGLRAHYQTFTQARMDRLRAAGFDAPFASLEEGVADYVKSYLATGDPYR